MSHCDALPDEFPGRSVRDIAELADARELSREPVTWTTTFQCAVCGQVWRETYDDPGHGEVPTVRKVSES
jgi:hypothetical protein